MHQSYNSSCMTSEMMSSDVDMATLRLYTNTNAAAHLSEEHVRLMLLHTCKLEDIDPSFIEDWLPGIQGPAFSSAKPDNDERALILRIVLTYRVFVEGSNGVNLVDFSMFVGLLVHGTLNVELDDNATFELVEVDNWIQEVIPVSIWDSTDIPPHNDDPYSGPPLAFCVPSSVPGHAPDPLTSLSYSGWGPDSPVDITSVTAVLLARTLARFTPAAAESSTAPTTSRTTSQTLTTPGEDSEDNLGSCPSLHLQSDSRSE
ncbi:hypothetical protein VTO73DRAFT_7141 [Trametes versicolor]